MLKKIVRFFGGDPNKQRIEEYSLIVNQINALEHQFEQLSDDALQSKTNEFRDRLEQGETLDELLVEAFATVREVSKRTIGQRHFDVQIIGGIAMHQGIVIEMRTGEGKTLAATLPLYLNALTGKGTHLVTVNDYLARRDARWMMPIYNTLGLTVGVLQMAARTENGKKAYLVDLMEESTQESQNQLVMVARREAYQADITYGTNNEFGFDYLRDNMTMRFEDRVQRSHNYAIIDEVDNVLIDEARTPLIISGPAHEEAEWYNKMARLIKRLRPEDIEINERDRNVTLTEIGESHIEQLLNMALRDPDRPEDVTPEQARILGYLEQALRAQYLFRRNKDYLVQSGKVVIVDEFTGRLMPGRRWSDGLHQAVEAKENVRVQAENVTYATITLQNYFRMYDKLSGMTGTALTEAEEFDKIYNLEVIPIPTNLEYIASLPDAWLTTLESKDEKGYKYLYYARSDDSQNTPVFWKRKDYPDVVYRTEEAKLRAMALEIMQYHINGQPILVGTTSVELSERVSDRLRAKPIRRLAQVMLLRNAWFEANDRIEDGRQIDELLFLNEALNKLNKSKLRKMARELDISFNPQEEVNLKRLLTILELDQADEKRLQSVLTGGVSHNVLNARQHTEESQIIAGAGAFGAVTIATNMAGRGVDIKLGGELEEEILTNVNRVLKRSGIENPYEMSLEKRHDAVIGLSTSDYGIYEDDINHFLEHMENKEKVRTLGGLHVIGSERHEARRIDNQLRGRSARQGDPGSSRFYLSMEDELMRLFGGQQADALMQRMKIDDAMPLEVGMVSRIVEQSQSRVEGANFDVREHLLEYDDVLNQQREKIYAQRDRIFNKDDLGADITDMLHTEVARRVQTSIELEEGPWKLLAWLEQIQPPLKFDSVVFPSYTIQMLTDHIFSQYSQDADRVSREDATNSLLDIAQNSIEAEREHILHTIDQLLDQTQIKIENQLSERFEALDTFIEGLTLDENTSSRNPKQILNELSNAVRTPLRLSSKQQQRFRNVEDEDSMDELAEEIHNQVEEFLISQYMNHLTWSVERRLDESLEINTKQLQHSNWDDLADEILTAVDNIFNDRCKRLLGKPCDQHISSEPGSNGTIQKDLKKTLSQSSGKLDRNQIHHLVMLMPHGTRTTFDKKTHRRIQQRRIRLSYIFHAAQLMQDSNPEELTDDVLSHLENARLALQNAWGLMEINRISSSKVTDVDKRTQTNLLNALGEDRYAKIENIKFEKMPLNVKQIAINELGSQALTELYRKLLLAVITELWVDYLTQMEALRVSIGLEAYAQRDPLVQYKNRAHGLFQELLGDMRLSVISRMFTYRPRDMSAVQSTKSKTKIPQSPSDSNLSYSTAREKSKKNRKKSGKKRKGRRRR